MFKTLYEEHKTVASLDNVLSCKKSFQNAYAAAGTAAAAAEQQAAIEADIKIGAAHSVSRTEWAVEVVEQALSMLSASDFGFTTFDAECKYYSSTDGSNVKGEFPDDIVKSKARIPFVGPISLISSIVPLVSNSAVEVGSIVLNVCGAPPAKFRIVCNSPAKSRKTFVWIFIGYRQR